MTDHARLTTETRGRLETATTGHPQNTERLVTVAVAVSDLAALLEEAAQLRESAETGWSVAEAGRRDRDELIQTVRAVAHRTNHGELLDACNKAEGANQ